MENKNLLQGTPLDIILGLTTIPKDEQPFTNSFYFRPSIPDKKLNGSIKKVSDNTVDPDDVLMIVDTTLFGSAEDGFLFTKDTIFYRSGQQYAIPYSSITQAEYVKNITTNKDGKEKITEAVMLHFNENTLEFKYQINPQQCAHFFESLMVAAQNKNEMELEEQYIERKPLEDMPVDLKYSYIQIVINFLLSDDGEIDNKESTELYKLVTRLKFTPEERYNILGFTEAKAETENLIKQLVMPLDELTKKEIKMSLAKDLIFIQKTAKSASYTESQYISELARIMELSDKELELINQAIEIDLKIYDDAVDDDGLKKGFSTLISTAGAIGVPLAALYFSGSVVGLGAAGITSGLATLGFGGVLGFSSMVTGLGAVLLIGLGAKKGLEHLTGKNEVDKRKLKEGLLLAVNKQLHSSINMLHEDINFITKKLNECWEENIELSARVEKSQVMIQSLIAKLTIRVNNGNELVKQQEHTECTAVRQQIPMQMDTAKLEALTNEPTTKKLYILVMNCYAKKDDLYYLREDLSVDDVNSLNEILTRLDYFGVSGIAKQGMSKLKGFFN